MRHAFHKRLASAANQKNCSGVSLHVQEAMPCRRGAAMSSLNTGTKQVTERQSRGRRCGHRATLWRGLNYALRLYIATHALAASKSASTPMTQSDSAGVATAGRKRLPRSSPPGKPAVWMFK